MAESVSAAILVENEQTMRQKTKIRLSIMNSSGPLCGYLSRSKKMSTLYERKVLAQSVSTAILVDK
ncbi:hypothetical protein [Siminovitchia sp. FSL W7-1587]|uniref:hypothetical protein n=1 Tax=Siminovitchia sp. FSL W7-1587 TaxID=2954699 RepID=UPI0030D276B3